jgi:hypothetical protein
MLHQKTEITESSKKFKYVCEKCSFNTNDKKDYKRHINTTKHKKIHKDILEDTKKTVLCICGNKYKYRSSYYRHKKKCRFVETTIDQETSNEEDNKIITMNDVLTNDITEEIAGECGSIPHLKGAESLDYKELILQVLNQNKELQDLLIKQQEEFMNYQKEQQEEYNKKYENLILHIKPNNNNTKTIIKNSNSNNKTINNNNHYNIMMFLNEKCKDAMTIQEFADRLVVSIDDLEKKKIDCLTNTILKNLKSLKITERPVHCGNIKRKEWYLNNKNTGWIMDNGEKLIKTTEYGINKKYKQEFKSHYPNYETHEQLQDRYTSLVHRIFTDLPEHEQSKVLNVVAKDLMIDFYE